MSTLSLRLSFEILLGESWLSREYAVVWISKLRKEENAAHTARKTIQALEGKTTTVRNPIQVYVI